MADPDKNGVTILLGIHQLLSKIHQRILEDGTPLDATNGQCGMDVGNSTKSSLPGVEKVYGGRHNSGHP